MIEPQASNDAFPRLDDRYCDDDLHGVHCQPHGHLATMGLNQHEKCPGWWQTSIIDDEPVGFRCACSCHPSPSDNR